MAKLFATTADWLTVASAVVTAPALTLHVWAKHTALGAIENIFSLGTSGSGDNRYYISKTADDQAHAIERDTVSGQANSANLPDTNWHGYTAVFTSHSLRDAYLDGVSKGSSATTRTCGVPNCLFLGRSPGGTASNFAGKLAYAAIWNRALTAAEIANLAIQTPDVAAASGLVAYYVLLNNALDTAGANNLSVAGAAGYDTDMPQLDGIAPACGSIIAVGQRPNLTKKRLITPDVGVVSFAGLAGGLAGTPSLPQPGVGLITMGGLAPTVSIVQGPSGAPDVGLISMQGLVPSLLKIKIVVPDINTSDADEVGLAPTIIPNWLLQPVPAAFSVAGLAPVIIANGSRTVLPGVGAVSIAGLAPVVSVPAGQEGLALPSAGQPAVVGQVPSLLVSRTVTPSAGLVSMAALLASTNVNFNWHDAPSASERSWHN